MGSILPIPVAAVPGFYFGIKPGSVVARLSGLWLALAALALFEPIAVAVHFEDVDVVGQSVEQRTGQPLGADDFMMPLFLDASCFGPAA